MQRFRSARLWCLLGVLWGIVLAQARWTPEHVVELKRVTSVAIQPQGNEVAYTLRVMRGADEKPGGAYSELWVVSFEGGRPRPFVQKPASVSQISWTPDGRWILFLMKRKAQNPHRQVYRIALSGGEAQPLSHAPRDIRQYRLSPDGRFLAYTMRDEEPDSLKEMRKKGYDQRVEDTWSTVTRLYVEDLATGEVAVITPDSLNVWEFTWGPESEQLIFRASRRPFVDDDYMFSQNYLVKRDGSALRRLYSTEGKLELAWPSPGGEYVAWLGATALNDPFPGSLFLLKKGASRPVNLTPGVPFTGTRIVWLNDKTLLLEAVENVHTVLYRVDVETGRRTKLLGGTRPILRRISLASGNRRFAILGNAPDHPDEVFAGQLGKSGLRRLTFSNPALDTLPTGRQEVISWKGPDQLNIYGVLIYPVDFQPGTRYPLVVQVHGGPESAYLDGWNTYYTRPLQLLAERGFLILIPNYRGSIGRGVEFAMADHRDMMGKEFEDILAGIDTLIARGLADPERVGITGGSYGGYTTAWAATRHSQRFAAGVMFAGISNQISKIGLTDTPQENQLVHWDLNAYENLDFFWERSPLKYWKNAQTPLLIAHGERDRRVPVGQAYELYRALRYRGVPVELVIYPREPHGLIERAHQLDFCRRAVQWFERYLKHPAAGRAR